MTSQEKYRASIDENITPQVWDEAMKYHVGAVRPAIRLTGLVTRSNNAGRDSQHNFGRTCWSETNNRTSSRMHQDIAHLAETVGSLF